MNNKRIVRGNKTVFPSGSEILGAYFSNAVTDRSDRDRGGRPISDDTDVIESRDFNIKKKT